MSDTHRFKDFLFSCEDMIIVEVSLESRCYAVRSFLLTQFEQDVQTF